MKPALIVFAILFASVGNAEAGWFRNVIRVRSHSVVRTPLPNIAPRFRIECDGNQCRRVIVR